MCQLWIAEGEKSCGNSYTVNKEISIDSYALLPKTARGFGKLNYSVDSVTVQEPVYCLWAVRVDRVHCIQLLQGVYVFFGTAACISPECVTGETVNQKADIWSFGCALLHIIAKKRP